MKNEFIKEAKIGDTLEIPLDKYVEYDIKNKYQFQGSLEDDKLANIMKQEDPIEASLKMRWEESGDYMMECTRLREHCDYNGKFFFRIRNKNDGPFNDPKLNGEHLIGFREKTKSLESSLESRSSSFMNQDSVRNSLNESELDKLKLRKRAKSTIMKNKEEEK